MSAELERRLRDAFAAPRPTQQVTRRARASVLEALPPAHRHGRRRRLVVALGAVAAATALGAAALGASGQLHVDLGAREPRLAPVRTQLTLPPRTNGIAVVAGGRLWLATRRGLRIEGMPASTAELSPRALYAVVGLGSSLVALAPGKRRAWTHPTPGPPVAAAWSPDGLKIAYVVRTRRGDELRLIEGDGDHDRLLDRHVAPSKPAWFGDSLRIVYERAGGRSATFDLRHGTSTVGRRMRPRHRAEAAATRGDRVAVAVRRPNRMLEIRIGGRRGGFSKLLLRVRAARTPVVISWR
jgi:hypothetical protein